METTNSFESLAQSKTTRSLNAKNNNNHMKLFLIGLLHIDCMHNRWLQKSEWSCRLHAEKRYSNGKESKLGMRTRERESVCASMFLFLQNLEPLIRFAFCSARSFSKLNCVLCLCSTWFSLELNTCVRALITHGGRHCATRWYCVARSKGLNASCLNEQCAFRMCERERESGRETINNIITTIKISESLSRF